MKHIRLESTIADLINDSCLTFATSIYVYQAIDTTFHIDKYYENFVNKENSLGNSVPNQLRNGNSTLRLLLLFLEVLCST